MSNLVKRFLELFRPVTEPAKEEPIAEPSVPECSIPCPACRYHRKGVPHDDMKPICDIHGRKSVLASKCQLMERIMDEDYPLTDRLVVNRTLEKYYEVECKEIDGEIVACPCRREIDTGIVNYEIETREEDGTCHIVIKRDVGLPKKLSIELVLGD